MTFDINSIPSQKGHVAIVTGANIGIGFETTRALIKKDITVLMACRNLDKANTARDQLLKEVEGADIKVMKLDLSQLQSVHDFAQAYQEKFQRLDLLINNAGIMVPPFSLSADGFESQMAANYFGHFLLTSLLMPLIENTENARIVTLSSIAHRTGRIHFSDLQFKKKYSAMKAYSQSKLACLMFGYELNRQLKSRGSQAISVIAHPGVSNTNLGQHLPQWINKYVIPVIEGLVYHKPEQAAQPTLYAALGLDVEGGDYFGPTGFNEMKGPAGKVKGKPHAYNEEIWSKLWQTSESLVGQGFFK